jgi:hypothetical protein
MSDYECELTAGILQDLLAIKAPQDVLLSESAGWRLLVFAYDWDIVLIADRVTSHLSLCTGPWPCALELRAPVRGQANGAVELSADAQLECLASVGCTKISVFSVAFTCRNNCKSLFKMQGSGLTISTASFVGCRSDTDGGVVQAYDLAEVVIKECNFTDVHSSGFGGAVAAYGSNLSISKSRLHNCSSRSGGGAVWASAFKDHYGSNRSTLARTYLLLSSSVFSLCITGRTCFGVVHFDACMPFLNKLRNANFLSHWQVVLVELSLPIRQELQQ